MNPVTLRLLTFGSASDLTRGSDGIVPELDLLAFPPPA